MNTDCKNRGLGPSAPSFIRKITLATSTRSGLGPNPTASLPPLLRFDHSARTKPISVARARLSSFLPPSFIFRQCQGLWKIPFLVNVRVFQLIQKRERCCERQKITNSEHGYTSAGKSRRLRNLSNCDLGTMRQRREDGATILTTTMLHLVWLTRGGAPPMNEVH